MVVQYIHIDRPGQGHVPYGLKHGIGRAHRIGRSCSNKIHIAFRADKLHQVFIDSSRNRIVFIAETVLAALNEFFQAGCQAHYLQAQFRNICRNGNGIADVIVNIKACHLNEGQTDIINGCSDILYRFIVFLFAVILDQVPNCDQVRPHLAEIIPDPFIAAIGFVYFRVHGDRAAAERCVLAGRGRNTVRDRYDSIIVKHGDK